MAEFDFCSGSRVIKEIGPEEPGVVSMNGWDFTARPVHPYRRTFIVKVYGMRWYVNTDGTYDYTTDPTHNAARLLNFYKDNRLFGTFDLDHPNYGIVVCRFKSVVNIEPAIPNSDGEIDPFEVNLLHHNPGY